MYKKISVRVPVYLKLIELQRVLGLTSISDVIALLLDHYDISSKLDELLARVSGTPAAQPSYGRDEQSGLRSR